MRLTAKMTTGSVHCQTPVEDYFSLCVNIRPIMDQHFRNLFVPILTSHVKRPPAVLFRKENSKLIDVQGSVHYQTTAVAYVVFDVNIRSTLDQHFGNLLMAILPSYVQCYLAIL